MEILLHKKGLYKYNKGLWCNATLQEKRLSNLNFQGSMYYENGLQNRSCKWTFNGINEVAENMTLRTHVLTLTTVISRNMWFPDKSLTSEALENDMVKIPTL
jgi:hypothetical protein